MDWYLAIGALCVFVLLPTAIAIISRMVRQRHDRDMHNFSSKHDGRRYDGSR